MFISFIYWCSFVSTLGMSLLLIYGSFIHSRQQALCQKLTLQISLPVCILSSHILNGITWWEILNFGYVHLMIFFFMICAFCILSKSSLPTMRSCKYSSMFSFRKHWSFLVSDFTWRIPFLSKYNFCVWRDVEVEVLFVLNMSIQLI